MGKYTNGKPWKFEIVNDVIYIYDNEGTTIAEVLHDDYSDQQKSNAQLIAAAPELLEALQDLVCCPAFNGKVFEKDSQSHKAWTLARYAIAKALGDDQS